MNYLQYFKDSEMTRAGLLHSSDLKASAICAGQGRHNSSARRWGTKSLASFRKHQLQHVPRAAKMLQVQPFSISPLPALLFQPSHRRCREPCVGAGDHLNHQHRVPSKDRLHHSYYSGTDPFLSWHCRDTDRMILPEEN